MKSSEGIPMQGMDIDAAFDPVKRQAQEDLNAYINSRPHQDDNGGLHDPVNGQFINSDNYFDQKREEHYEETQSPYEDMSMGKLARKLGDAELHEDQTTADDVLDVLLEKIDNHVEQAKANHDKSNDEVNGDMHAAWLDRLMKVKEDYKRKQTEQTNPTEKENLKDTYDRFQNGEAESTELNEAFNEAFAALKDKYQNDPEGLERARQEMITRIKGGKFEDDIAMDRIKDVEQRLSADDGKSAREKIKDVLDNVYPGASLKEEDIDQNHPEYDGPVHEGMELVPVTDPTPAGRRQRLSRIIGKAGDKIKDLWANVGARVTSAGQRTKEYFNDEENGKRRKIVAGVLGAAALVGGAYLIYKGLETHGGEKTIGEIQGDKLPESWNWADYLRMDGFVDTAQAHYMDQGIGHDVARQMAEQDFIHLFQS